MKKYIILSLTLAGLMLTSCKDYLTAPEPAQTLLSDYYSSGDACIYNVNGCYVPLMWEYSSTYCCEWFIGDIMSDDALKGGQNTNDMGAAFDLENWRTESNNDICYDLYRANYYGIARCNMAIKNIPNASIDSVMTASVRSRLVGEAKFLRAYYYFRLLRMFGQLPITLDVISDDAQWVCPRSSINDVFNVILADLTDAEEVLWKKSEYPAADLGRATKGAAQAMLLKTYLYMASPYWNKSVELSADSCYRAAAKWGQRVIESKEYSLCGNYADNFTLAGENGIESVFEIQYVEDPTSDYGHNEGGFGATRGTFTVILTRSRSSMIGGEGWGFNMPTHNLYNEYEEGDIRRDATILNPREDLIENPIQETYCGTRFLNRKYALYLNEDGTEYEKLAHHTRGAINNKQIRYADVLLMTAEAYLGNNEAGKALDLINQVRARVGLSGITTADETSLRHERRCELAMEGHRWFDLVRWGNTKAHMDAYKATESEEAKKHMLDFIENKHELLPIPSKERVLNSALDQNNGY